jgi:hypothetical protein
MTELAALHRCRDVMAIGKNRVPSFSREALAELARGFEQSRAACGEH